MNNIPKLETFTGNTASVFILSLHSNNVPCLLHENVVLSFFNGISSNNNFITHLLGNDIQQEEEMVK